MFILTAPNCPLSGEYEGARLLDMVPTLLDLAGTKFPNHAGAVACVWHGKKGPGGGSDEESQKIVRDRLAGLGYV